MAILHFQYIAIKLYAPRPLSNILPASPDKAAVLLLLAKYECVGVSSLDTIPDSHVLSCGRRPT